MGTPGKASRENLHGLDVDRIVYRRHWDKFLHGGQKILLNQKASAEARASVHRFEADSRNFPTRAGPVAAAGEVIEQKFDGSAMIGDARRASHLLLALGLPADNL